MDAHIVRHIRFNLQKTLLDEAVDDVTHLVHKLTTHEETIETISLPTKTFYLDNPSFMSNSNPALFDRLVVYNKEEIAITARWLCNEFNILPYEIWYYILQFIKSENNSKWYSRLSNEKLCSFLQTLNQCTYDKKKNKKTETLTRTRITRSTKKNIAN